MVHQYKLNGYNIVLDTCSGSVHSVDEVAYDIISMYKNFDKEDIVALAKEMKMKVGIIINPNQGLRTTPDELSADLIINELSEKKTAFESKQTEFQAKQALTADALEDKENAENQI